MADGLTNEDPVSDTAPRYLVPDLVAMTVEHPCIVKNVDRAMRMLGGASAIAGSQQTGIEVPLHLSFRPEDLTSRPFVSTHMKTNNILLQVAVPKRTGRKRKRGSADPFVEDVEVEAPPKDAKYVLRSIQDNPKSYSVEPLAKIPSTHVWRGMPDFVYSTAQSDFLKDIREKVLPTSYPLMKQYRLPQNYGLANTEVLPPPQLSSQTIPINYSYRANPSFRIFSDPTTGEKSLYHGKDSRKTHMTSIQWYDGVPVKVSASLPPLSSKSPDFQSNVQLLRKVFDRQPIWTRRALINQLPPTLSLQNARAALAYVAFGFRSGPWRDTVCLIGVDPRSDPKYRIYQSLMIQLVKKPGREDSLPNDSGDEGNPWADGRNWKRSTNTESHTFTGTGDLPPDGKIWQVCDITDPQLKAVVEIDEGLVETACEVRARGFYPAGTWAKLKLALKYKIEALQTKTLDEYGRSIDRLLMLPDTWDGKGSEADAVAGKLVGAYLPADFKGKEMHWAALWRASVRRMMQEEKAATQKEKGKGKSVRFADEDGSTEMNGTPRDSVEPAEVEPDEGLDEDITDNDVDDVSDAD